jgi:hypothetical protein
MAAAAKKTVASPADLTAAKPTRKARDTAALAAAEPADLPGADLALNHRGHDDHETQAGDEHFDAETHAHFPESWQEPQKLDAPTPRPGMEQRWVRVDIKGEADPNNVASQFRQGWRPRSFDTVPQAERARFPSINIKTFGAVMKTGDLILCEMPKGIFEQMKAFYAARARKQLAAISPEAVVAQHNSQVDPDHGFGEIEVTRRSGSGTGRVPMVARDD